MSGVQQYSYSGTSRVGRSRKLRLLNGIVDRHIAPTKDDFVVLEAGAGRGEFASIVVANGLKYIAIEPSEKLRAQLSQDGYTVIAEALPEIALPDGSVDAIFAGDVIEHLESYSVVLAFFAECGRVLRDGGLVVTYTPNAETLGKLFWQHEYQHNFVTTRERLEALMQDSDLAIDDSYTCFSGLGLSDNKVIWLLDRIIAHLVLFFVRSPLIDSIAQGFLGRSFMKKIHKNVYDHFVVVGRVRR